LTGIYKDCFQLFEKNNYEENDFVEFHGTITITVD
jgi:hypothetical protein